MVDSATWLPFKHLLQPNIPSSQEGFNTWVCDNPAVMKTGGGRDAFEAEKINNAQREENLKAQPQDLNILI